MAAGTDHRAAHGLAAWGHADLAATALTMGDENGVGHAAFNRRDRMADVDHEGAATDDWYHPHSAA